MCPLVLNSLVTGPKILVPIGSPFSSVKTTAFVSAIEQRQGLKIACLEEISYSNKWINKSKILNAIKFYGNCEYSKYLKKLI